MKLGEVIISAAFLLIGSYVAIMSLGLQLTGPVGPGPGFMPLLAGSLLAALSLVHLTLQVLPRRIGAAATGGERTVATTGPITTAAIMTAENDALVDPEGHGADDGPITRYGAIRLAAVVGAQIAFVILFQLVGFAVATFAFVFFVVKLLGRTRWLTATLWALGLSVLYYVCFDVLLRIPFPTFFGLF